MISFVRSNWEATLLVCRKCSKKQSGGFGPKRETPLAKALRRALDAGKGRKAKIGVIEVKCLGICPRHAVTMVDARNPREWLLVKPGSDIAEVVSSLALRSPVASPSTG